MNSAVAAFRPLAWLLAATLVTSLAAVPTPAWAVLSQTATTVTGPSTAVVGVPTSLTASVSPSSAAGVMQFTVNAIPVGLPVTVSSGVASLPYTFSGAGTKTVGATFVPSDVLAYVSSSDTASVTVTAAPPPPQVTPTTTTVVGPSTASVGSPVSLVANVAPSGAAGLVQFTVDGIPAGLPVSVASGVASRSYTFASAGTKTVGATFVPSDVLTYGGSSDTGSVTVTAGPPPQVTPTTTTVVGPSTASVGSPVSLVANVAPSGAAGLVQFTVDGIPAGLPVSVASGVASLSYTFASAGTKTVGATFVPSDVLTYGGSSDTGSVTVTAGPPPQVTPTTTTVVGPSTASVGSPVSLVANVAPSGAAGLVQFTVDGIPAGLPVSVASGVASLSYTFASAGTKTVGATFVPLDLLTYGGSSDTGIVTVSDGPAKATTTTVVGPSTASVGSPVSLVANVSPSDAAGTVQFTVDGAAAGSPVALAGGTASRSYTFSTKGTHTVRAAFTPSDAAAYVASADNVGRAVNVTAARTSSTTVLVTPATVRAGDATKLAATVIPADAAGVLTFYVDGTAAGTTAVDDGAATVPHTFVTPGSSRVLAVFTPTDDARYGSSMGHRTIVVQPGPTAATTISALSVLLPDLHLGGACSGGRTTSAVVQRDEVTTVLDFLFRVFGSVYETIREAADSFRARFTAVLCGVGGRGASVKAGSVHGAMDCIASDGGYRCPLSLPAYSELTLSAAVPVPASLAGKRIELGSSFSLVDPETGELSELGTEQTVVRVPRRTVLAATLAPVRSSLTSVGRGKPVAYRLNVKNAGIVNADKVRACVTAGSGVSIRSARGATVRGRQACWTLPSLKGSKSVARTLTLVAPAKARPLTLSALVKPQRRQADPVRLATALPVR